MGIKENLEQLKITFKKQDCLLVAVSKTKPPGAIKEAYEAGIRDFGENKVQELVEKAPQLPKDIRWHMIGHLQRNKVKHIVPFVYLIHGVDSLRLLKQINKEGEKVKRVIPCLLQIHIAKEESKFGLDEKELEDIIWGKEMQHMEFIKIKGLMGMATNTDNPETVRKEFGYLKSLFEEIKTKALPKQVEMEELSMGMSGDYPLALEAGSTIVRIGSAIFGARNYNQTS
ncbi:YggS family pyridoxal phosphate-dependent enzyme [Negadavirga shengliensis]|uniref:Pyridoxal phosphate homeostasis protein n=1 Tax=Negadavirga shengliensis TaxID=1389218 RepID=A0ABV9T5N3_9BACT